MIRKIMPRGNCCPDGVGRGAGDRTLDRCRLTDIFLGPIDQVEARQIGSH